MVSGAERGVPAQRVHIESLGETEGKRSYRRDTVVLALPGLEKAIGEKGMDTLRSKRRATGRAHALESQSLTPFATYSRPELRNRAIGSVTAIG